MSSVVALLSPFAKLFAILLTFGLRTEKSIFGRPTIFQHIWYTIVGETEAAAAAPFRPLPSISFSSPVCLQSPGGVKVRCSLYLSASCGWSCVNGRTLAKNCGASDFWVNIHGSWSEPHLHTYLLWHAESCVGQPTTFLCGRWWCGWGWW